MSWFLWNSRAGHIDYGCLRARGGAALGLTDFAGIAINLIFLALAPLVGRWWRTDLHSGGSRWDWFFLITFLWVLANYAEAFSYLVLNTIWLKSDMETVVMASGISRWVWLGTGFLLAVLIGWFLRQPALRAAAILAAPRGSTRVWLRAFVLYVAVVSGAMGGLDTTTNLSGGYTRLHALNVCVPENRRVRWLKDVPSTAGSGYPLGPPTINNGMVYVGTNQGHLIVIGDPRVAPMVGWRCSDPDISTPICAILGSLGSVTRLVPDPFLKDIALPGAAAIFGEPALAGDRVFVADTVGKLFMLEP